MYEITTMSLEVLFNCEHNKLKRAEDALLCCIHCSFISNGYKCIGNGEVITDENIKKSDMLPAGWSEGTENYALIYQSADPTDSSKLMLKVVTFDGLMLVHLLRPLDEKAVAIEIKTADFATQDLSSFESAYKDLESLQQRLKTELIVPFQQKTPVTPQSMPDSVRPPVVGQERERSSVDPLRVPSHRPPIAGWGPQRDPFGIGRSDLDPFQSTFGRGGLGGSDLDPLSGLSRGGGMIFDPMHSGGFNSRYGGGLGGPSLPRGAIVPGARFDPFGPPDLDRGGSNSRFPGAGSHRSDPDPDHLPPPGYDDMFM